MLAVATPSTLLVASVTLVDAVRIEPIGEASAWPNATNGVQVTVALASISPAALTPTWLVARGSTMRFAVPVPPAVARTTLTRLEKAGLVTSEREPGLPDRPDRKVYELTALGQQRVTEWLTEVSWPRPDLTEFHLKLIAAAAARLADPLAIVDGQRRELLRRLRDAQRAALAEPDDSTAALLLEGIVLRLQADLRWLEACERNWTDRRNRP